MSNSLPKTRNDSSIFLSNAQSAEWYYSHLRDSKNETEERAYLEECWTLYRPLCPDPDFQEKLAKDIYAMLWHLHLARVLIDYGFKLITTKEGEPDLCLEVNDRRIWIEVVAAKPGNGPDAVRVAPRGVGAIPEDQITLRFIQSVSSKLAQHEHFLSDERHAQDSYIIAVNTGLVPLSDLNDGVNIAEKALYGIGDFQWTVAIDSGEVTNSGYVARTELTKRSGNKVSASLFSNSLYSRVSAVLYTPHHFRNNWHAHGRDFEVIHNPMATVACRSGVFQMGTEAWIQDGLLKRKDWRAPQ